MNGRCINNFNDYFLMSANTILNANSKIFSIAERLGSKEIMNESHLIKMTLHNTLLNINEDIIPLNQSILLNDILLRVINDINVFYPSVNIGFTIFNHNLVANLDSDLFHRALTNLLINLVREEEPDKINIVIKSKDDKAIITITTKNKPLLHIFEYKLVMQALQLLKINMKDKSSEKELKYVLEVPLTEEVYSEIGEIV